MAIVKGFKEGVRERWQQHRIMCIISIILLIALLVLLSTLIVQIDVRVTR